MYWVTVHQRFHGKIYGKIIRYGPYHSPEEAQIALEDAQELFPDSEVALVEEKHEEEHQASQ
jgi:hypothetical protein